MNPSKKKNLLTVAGLILLLLACVAAVELIFMGLGEAIPNIISTPFMSCFSTITGAGITGGLVFAIMVFSKRGDYRAIAKLAIPCAIFNINEPLIFGLPIVYNPALAIPFIVAPLVTMSMGSLGVISRVAGEAFGSCITFGADGDVSAPGQMQADRLEMVLEALHEGMA